MSNHATHPGFSAPWGITGETEADLGLPSTKGLKGWSQHTTEALPELWIKMDDRRVTSP